MRTFAEIHATNPYLDLLGDGLYDANGELVGDFKIHRAVFAWTERTEALEVAQYALANAGEGFKELHSELYSKMYEYLDLNDWAEAKRIEDTLTGMWKFRQEWMGEVVKQASARLTEINGLLKSISAELTEGIMQP